MEKVINTNEVETSQESKKLSYEQLEQVAHQLSDRNKQLTEYIQKNNVDDAIKRLGCLFSVINSGKFPEDFMELCIKEAMSIINLSDIPEDTTEK